MQAIGLTDIGNHRMVNEDSYFVSTSAIGALPNLFIVADGLGGHAAGDMASKIAVDATVAYCQNAPAEISADLLKNAFEQANEEVQVYGKTINKLYEMGSTLIAASIFDDYYQIANVGDSRAYLYRDGSLQKLTKDHSLVQKLQEEGVITEEEAFSHEKRNLILRAIGMEPIIQVDTYTDAIKNGDIIMLCSDGLSNFIRRQAMEEIFRQEDNISALAQRLLDTALANGGSDNITVVVVKNAKESEDDLC
ncbi:Stp1/IreP family PP2C-type Ser/Thr phosphatase [Clostridiales bacterium COT073_COT-073]|nr:Stp1/IreP family PP2C-type Ser/Thr phosphatase [Clostridiales bacterium COT073_COT-073]